MTAATPDSFDLLEATVADVHAAMEAGEVTAEALVERYLDRIDRYDDELNAVLTLNSSARERARDLDRRHEADGPVGPLHGVPTLVKDNHDTADMATSAGCTALADSRPPRDAFVVDRLRDAGAVILGKTNLQELSFGVDTISSLGGETRNAYSRSHRPSGSSGGTAVAVAANLATLGTGSDTCSSVRSPPAFNACVGVRPTRGLLSRTGVIPLSETQDTAGPITRTVADAALLFDVLQGPHSDDPLCLPDDGTDYREATRGSVEGLSVAYSLDLGVFPVDERVRTVVDDALDAFADAGMDVSRVDVDFGRSREEICEWWLRAVEVKYAATADVLAAEHGVDYTGADRGDVTPEFAAAIERGEAYGAKEYVAANRVRTDVFRGFERVFEDHDLLVAPTLAVPPVANAEDGNTLGPSEVDGESVNPLIGWCLTYPFNMSGHPVANVPAGLDGDGLPVGMQVAGRRFADGTVLAASAAVERVRPWDGFYPPRA